MDITIEVEERSDLEKKVLAGLNPLLERTNKPNPKPEDMPLLKETFDTVPSLALQAGNINQTIFSNILECFAGGSAFIREASKRHIEMMKTELGYQSSSFMEKMLIDEILMRWLRLQVMKNDHKVNTYQEHTFNKGLYYDKRLHLAQKRYLRALEALAKIRKMIVETQAKGAEMYKNLTA